RDDELRRGWHGKNEDISINGTLYPAANLKFHYNFSDSASEYKHYHFLSLSREESIKMQRAFGADGYVLINDIETFYKTINNSLKDSAKGTEMDCRTVKYYDDRDDPKFSTL